MLSVAAEEEKKQRAFAVPELEYNLKLLLDLSESDIVQIDRQYVDIFLFHVDILPGLLDLMLILTSLLW